MIIGLHGKAGAGKDTFADYLVATRGYVKRGFATPLYEEVAAAFGVTVAWLADRSRKEVPQPELSLLTCKSEAFFNCIAVANNWSASEIGAPRSPRWVLQYWGTEYRRLQDVEYWLKQMALYAKAAYETGARGIAIVDARFQNEAEWVRMCGGAVVEIRRPGLPAVEGEHTSAAGLPAQLIDHALYNTAKTLKEFHASIEEFMRSVLGSRVKRSAGVPVPA